MKKLLLISFLITFLGCSENSASNEGMFCAEAKYIEEGFSILTGKFKGEIIDYPSNLVRFNPPELNQVYIVDFTDSLTIINRQKQAFDENGNPVNGCS